MISQKLRPIWMIVFATALMFAGCGGDSGSSNNGGLTENNGNANNGNANNGNANNGACEHACSATGAMRCTDGVIEACTVDDNGCKIWEAGIDCANSDRICDEQGDVAECVGGADETCDDGTKNQDETDVDCGGSVCDACSEGAQCEEARDCDTNNCDAHDTDQCVAADAETCTDGTKNQDETDVDCGGATCSACQADQACTQASDCASNYCDTDTGVCLAEGPSCDDGTKNQDETDVDCGGATCSACTEGYACQAASDCSTGNCDVGGTDACVAADTETCTDGTKNQDETDVDCGGATCSACAIGATCTEHTDCFTLVCDFIDTDTCIDATPSYEVDEDFETGDFSLFPYDLSSDNTVDPTAWEIEQTAANCHAGSHCMRSNSNHREGETTEVSLSLSVRQDTVISFWVKTNTEPGEHFFRFYIDGQQQVELSGQNAWQQVTFPVSATGPNGPNRTFTWEYSRSTFLDPNHVPWNEVWVDDIDMPEWNTEPTTPEQLAPWNGKLTTDRSPMFRWRSFDADFDTIIYEMEYDTDPTFPDPDGTGETNDTQFTPPTDLDDQTVYYWRVRAKDDNNYRWSDWSPTWTVEIDSTYEYAAVWRQSAKEQFELNDLASLDATTGGVVPQSGTTDLTRNASFSTTGATVTMDYASLTSVPGGVTATLDVTTVADINGTSEYADVFIENTSLGRITSTQCGPHTRSFSISDIGQYVSDGQTSVRVSFGSSVNPICSDTVSARLRYSVPIAGTMTTEPIDFALFGGKTYWEKVQWKGSGDVSLQILDESGALIPDSVIPDNSAGLTSNTVHLWNLDPVQYPKIRLKATLEGNGVLTDWRVVANDVFEWTFSHDGDQEGWEAKDHNGAPTASVSGGILRYESTVGGDDPRIEYWFPQPIDASRFTALEVRVKTSNNYNNDDVTLFWDSNYGGFDTRRSFTNAGVFLLDFQDQSFDLTVVPSSPNEPWQGQVNAIRIDPIVRFKDQAGAFSDGWFEVERIAIY